MTRGLMACKKAATVAQAGMPVLMPSAAGLGIVQASELSWIGVKYRNTMKRIRRWEPTRCHGWVPQRLIAVVPELLNRTFVQTTKGG